MTDNVLTQTILVVSGALFSVLAKYVPFINQRWEMLMREKKQLIMLGLCTLTAIGIAVLSAMGWLNLVDFSNSDSVMNLIIAWFMAIASNQAVNKITPDPGSVG